MSEDRLTALGRACWYETRWAKNVGTDLDVDQYAIVTAHHRPTGLWAEASGADFTEAKAQALWQLDFMLHNTDRPFQRREEH